MAGKPHRSRARESERGDLNMKIPMIFTLVHVLRSRRGRRRYSSRPDPKVQMKKRYGERLGGLEFTYYHNIVGLRYAIIATNTVRLEDTT